MGNNERKRPRVKLSKEAQEKLVHLINKKLAELETCMDKELTEYITVLIANGKTKEDIVGSLDLFLAKNAEPFTKWLMIEVKKLKELDKNGKLSPKKTTVDSVTKPDEPKPIKEMRKKDTKTNLEVHKSNEPVKPKEEEIPKEIPPTKQKESSKTKTVIQPSKKDEGKLMDMKHMPIASASSCQIASTVIKPNQLKDKSNVSCTKELKIESPAKVRKKEFDGNMMKKFSNSVHSFNKPYSNHIDSNKKDRKVDDNSKLMSKNHLKEKKRKSPDHGKFSPDNAAFKDIFVNIRNDVHFEKDDNKDIDSRRNEQSPPKRSMTKLTEIERSEKGENDNHNDIDHRQTGTSTIKEFDMMNGSIKLSEQVFLVEQRKRLKRKRNDRNPKMPRINTNGTFPLIKPNCLPANMQDWTLFGPGVANTIISTAPQSVIGSNPLDLNQMSSYMSFVSRTVPAVSELVRVPPPSTYSLQPHTNSVVTTESGFKSNKNNGSQKNFKKFTKSNENELKIPCKYYPNCTKGAKCTFSHGEVNEKVKNLIKSKTEIVHDGQSTKTWKKKSDEKNNNENEITTKKKILCTLFPNCTYGERCAFEHPTCRYGDSCTKPNCPYQHNNPKVKKTIDDMANIDCYYGQNCTRSGCAYKHPRNPFKWEKTKNDENIENQTVVE
ncbi:hypothetical protein SNEBB_005539 [Seison nebaliae]|nr:hypothetical protein SNEBB_005539 [Seison nebaliae]